MKFSYFKPLFTVFVLLFCSISSLQATEKIKATFFFSNNYSTVYLYEIIGKNSFVIDSFSITNPKSMELSISEKPKGFYQLGFNDTNKIDIILSPSEDLLEIDFYSENLIYDLKIKNSLENKLLWGYKYKSKAVNDELIIFDQLLATAPFQNEEMKAALKEKVDSLYALKRIWKEDIYKHYPETFISKVMLLSNYSRNVDSSKTYQQQHFFDLIDFNEIAYVRSSVLADNYMEYFYRHTEYTETGFQNAVDEILGKAKENPQVYEFTLNFLLELFNKVGPDMIFQYIVEQYLLDGGCSEVNIDEQMKNLAASYRALMPGNFAPDFIINDSTETPIQLYEEISKKPYTLLLFWSSHCGYCHEAMPKVKEQLVKNKEVQIIGVSLDDNAAEWKNYLKENELPWVNVSQLKSWDSPIVKKYKVHKTPTFYLLNNRKIILGKSINADDIFELVK